MNTQRFLLSLVYSLVGIVLLSACNNGHLRLTNFQTLSIDSTGRYTLQIPVKNGGYTASPPAELTVKIEYTTISNGGSLRCNSDISPKSPPCKPPVRCSETLVYQIPSLKALSLWDSPSSIIGPAAGECACLQGQCSGAVTLTLRSLHDPNLENRMNVTQLITWSTQHIILDGYYPE